MSACGFGLHWVSATGHRPYIPSALLKLSNTNDMVRNRAEVGPESARQAGELRIRMSRLSRRLRREDRGYPLTIAQLSALGRLDRLGAATLGELAAGERIRPQSMARTLDSLEAAGLVVRAPHPTDRRRHILRLTGPGYTAIAENRHRDAWLARAMASALSPAERDLLSRASALLDRLAEFEDDPGEDGEDDPPGAAPGG
jgi:DNA-binding MarR family transcriptional regulator